MSRKENFNGARNGAGVPSAASPEYPGLLLRNQGVKGGVPRTAGNAFGDLELERGPHGNPAPAAEHPVIEPPSMAQPAAVRGKSHARDYDEVRLGRRDLPAAGSRLRDSKRPFPELPEGVHPEEDELMARHARECHNLSPRQGPAHERGYVGLAPHRRIGEHDLRAAVCRHPLQPAADAAAPGEAKKRRNSPPPLQHPAPKGALAPRKGGIHIRLDSIIAACLAALSLPLSGCLPGLVNTARTLRPGEMTFAMGGMGRTGVLPDNVAQGGNASGMIELRGGLPFERADSAITLQLPWNASWDVRYQFISEDTFVPAVAGQFMLGAAQPALLASLAATKTFGKVSLTGLASTGHVNEQLWRPGSGPYSGESETLAKDVYAWGGGIEVEASPIHRLFAGLLAWNNAHEQEAPARKDGEFHVDEGVSWFITAGLRIVWKQPPPPRPAGALTVLRGYLLQEPANNRFELGQPGLFRAVVLTDAFTKAVRDGKTASLKELKAGIAVLVQGIPLPQPSTFLARTIELQGP